ncbi:MAG: hypothetical protein SH847_19670 [Roseiflexaceae bacterium]|nr:hypothetical protein [Roseiflexaceae bacterium]
MAETTIYEDLKQALTEFKQFLTTNKDSKIKPALHTLKELLPSSGDDLINRLIDEPISLLRDLRDKIDQLIGTIGGTTIGGAITDVHDFNQQLQGLLTSMTQFLPDQRADIERAINISKTVAGLPTLADIKQELNTLLNEIIALLQDLKTA